MTGSPSRLHDLALDDLRSLRQHLMGEECLVSYWRRLLQTRLDLINEMTETGLDGLESVLRESQNAPRRWQALGLEPNDDHPMPDVEALWRQVVDLTDDEQRMAYLHLVTAMEKSLSQTRRALHQQIDAVTAELIRRYRTNPALVLTALDTRRVRA